jgi:hypothetical protein
MKLNYGDIAAQKVSERYAEPVASLTVLKAIPADRRVAGMQVLCTADGSRWRFHSSSALTGDDLLVVAPTAGSGRWLRMPGALTLKMAIAFGTADNAVLLTMPTGGLLKLDDLFWQVDADFTGGAASAIGIHSNKTAPTNWTTKGDILGGATGDVAATLLAATGIVSGTVGTDMDTVAKRRGAILKAGDTLAFGRITSAFTAGSGYLHAVGVLLTNDGA